MTQTLDRPSALPPVEEDAPPPRFRWTRALAHAAYDAGLIAGRYELIEGELYSKIGQKPPHRIGVTALRKMMLTAHLARKATGARIEWPSQA